MQERDDQRVASQTGRGIDADTCAGVRLAGLAGVIAHGHDARQVAQAMEPVSIKEETAMHDYNAIPQIVIAVAQEAGAILRADLLQPGGPAGHRSHAAADDAAELYIRDRLCAETPTWAFRGEETDTHMPSGWPQAGGPAYIWLVDPNDGTSSYLQGARGSAVSIALLRDGIPVLGVVYAFAAPDNEGDLFAWAEGCGSILRNHAAVQDSPPVPG